VRASLDRQAAARIGADSLVAPDSPSCEGDLVHRLRHRRIFLAARRRDVAPAALRSRRIPL